ncbi:TolC family protein [Xanthomonas nasturtii]|uniref:TolC family protein n=1 Tax=Xanthomonas nasturtii TaxID=1843581 RepID=A0A3E1KEZ3_9XANT|nr:TolC family protein [Xanthomonas nasturtii]MCL1500297.1 TolC family protein [Xanthomonas nasturtii]MCL1504231.1 TolC family protein [Xanthomonas nasturtii]MCL1523077.1 TolC family protein [Xanthomonas nasturtii]MCL1530980.1 TolC family protein [Xanthomonas nasturtii]MCL1565791.1 TolC family protein [Xanthomonas nasturtii]
MWFRLAAFAACAFAPALFAQERAPSQTLTLERAIEQVAQTHPDLRLVDGQRAVLQANYDSASLKPPLTLGATVENALGSGPYRAFDQAEITVTLAGVLERGGKLDARRALAQANIDKLAPQREVMRLDLLAETARRYLAVTAAIRQREIADLDIEQRRRTVEAAKRRLAAGASPESVVLTAQASLAEAELDRDRASQSEKAARQALSSLWNSRSPADGTVSGDPLTLPGLEDFAVLSALLERTPELVQLAGEVRIREAQLRLVRSDATPDIQWQVGGRAFRNGNDVGVLAGFSIPLGSSRRAQPGIRAAEAELALTDVERESLLVGMNSALATAYGDYATAQLEVQRLQSDVLPRLAKAETAADRAWRAGAISYMEWALLQDQRVQARRRQLDAALSAQSALIEVQRLLGQPIVKAQGAANTDTSSK